MSLGEIKLEQKLVAVFSLLGAMSGYVSNYLSYNEFYPFVATGLIYGASLLVASAMSRKDKKNIVVSNSLITFLLVWIVVWTFLYNI